ncbi:MAG TPA: hypothetical protein VF055_04535 [Steroidobacteraceae bacterium]
MALARLAVAARVEAHVRLAPVESDGALTITDADLDRGYLDVTRRYALRTNAPDRVRLQVHPRVGYTTAVDIAGVGPTVRLQETSVELWPAAGRHVEFVFRLWLAPGLAPGQYPLPVHVAAVVL